MENKAGGRPFRPILITFLIISVLIIASRSLLAGWKTDWRVLLGGNVILFLVTAASYYLYTRALNNANAHVFVRMMYSSLLVKIMVCGIAAIVYALVAGQPNKNGIIGCFIWYILYTYLEVKILTQLNKKAPKNA